MTKEKIELIKLIKTSCRGARSFLLKLNFNNAYLDLLNYLEIQLCEIEAQDLSVLDSNVFKMVEYKSNVTQIFSIFLSCKTLFELILSDENCENTVTIDRFNDQIPQIQKILESIATL